MTIIFVFGSNTSGRHGKGAAYYAQKYYGATYGVGEGRQGNSYAIPTKDGSYANLRDRDCILSLKVIRKSLRKFVKYAHANPDCTFLFTPIGTGEAGYEKADILRLLHDISGSGKGTPGYDIEAFRKDRKSISIPDNILFTKEWFSL